MKHAVFIHGGPGFPDYLEPFFVNQFSKSIQPIFYTQATQEADAVNGLKKQLQGVLEGLEFPCFLIGHSWGATLILEYLRTQAAPNVKAIVLMDGCLCSNEFHDEYQQELSRLKLSEPTLEQIFLSDEEMKIGTPTIQKLMGSFDESFFRKFDLYLKSFDLRPTLKGLSVPVLNIFGERDIRMPARVLRQWNHINPKIQTREIPGAGHFPFLLEKNRKIIVKTIEKFIEQADSKELFEK